MLVVAGLFVALCLAYFNQAFRPVSKVSLHISRSGLQLLPGSDVKVRGLIVGDVSSITSDGDGAVVHLRLDPQPGPTTAARPTSRPGCCRRRSSARSTSTSSCRRRRRVVI